MDSKVIGRDNEELVHLAHDGNQRCVLVNTRISFRVCVLQFLVPSVCNCVPTISINVAFRLQATLGSGTFEGEDIVFRQKSETDSTLTECDVSAERYP